MKSEVHAWKKGRVGAYNSHVLYIVLLCFNKIFLYQHFLTEILYLDLTETTWPRYMLTACAFNSTSILFVTQRFHGYYYKKRGRHWSSLWRTKKIKKASREFQGKVIGSILRGGCTLAPGEIYTAIKHKVVQVCRLAAMGMNKQYLYYTYEKS